MAEARATRSTPRVAVVYPAPFGAEGFFGGGERYALELASALARRVPTRLVTFAARERRERIGDLEICVHRPLRYVRGARFNPLSFGFLRDLADVDVVHCASWNTLVSDFAVLWGKLTGKRVYVTDVGGGASFTLAGWLGLGRLVNGFLLIAPQGGHSFERWRSRWSVILAGIDTQRFAPRAEVPREGVLFVGRLVPHKGVDVLIQAVDAGVPLRIVGRPYDHGYYELLRGLARGKRVVFITDASDDQIVSYYQSAAIAVLPSVTRTVYGERAPLPELLGFALLEAMSCGAAVVCTDVGALAEVVVDGECGYVVPPGDIAALRDRLQRLLQQPALAARLGGAARRRIEDRFTWERVAQRCLQAYAQ
jgi:glycosyltransferase involved in cell wall biosynthesis